ncbi:MAG: 3-hydroxylacyl-ACP dehydratase [Gammaproteobacteria bacterium]|nr:3-hydroxylacyl-ACP dehydratase [Gammaproteobacteria bacterium]
MERREFGRLIPHTGTMSLLDRVLAWDADGIRCSASSHRNPGHPLAEDGRLHAVCGVEYAAQAVALHAALAAPPDHAAEPVPGYLAGIRRLELMAMRLDDITEDLIVDARCQVADGGGLLYEFDLTAGSHRVLAGSLTILFPRG